MSELLDCPFCPDGGSPAVVHHQSQHHGAKGVYFKDRGYSVKCGDCDALIGTDNRCDEYGDTDGNFGSEEEATEAWNTRSYKPELLAEFVKLRDAAIRAKANAYDHHGRKLMRETLDAIPEHLRR